MARGVGRTTGRVTMTALVFIGAAWVFDMAVFPIVRMMTAGDSSMLIFGVAMIHLAVIATAYAALRGRISAGLFGFMAVVYAGLAALAWFGFGLPGVLRLASVPLSAWSATFG